MQPTVQEQYESVKFEFHEFQAQLDKLTQFSMTACQTPTQNTAYNLINIRDQLAQLKADFGTMQTKVLDGMESQNNIQQRQKSKNKRYKKLLKEYQTQTCVMAQDQKEFEESITKEHNTNQGKIKTLLDKFEKQVALRKTTINTLHEHRKDNYEKLMDDAVGKIRRYFNKIEDQNQSELAEHVVSDEHESELTAASVFEPINELRKIISANDQSEAVGSDIDDSGFDEVLNKTDAGLAAEQEDGNNNLPSEVQIQAPKNVSKIGIPRIPLEVIGRVPVQSQKQQDLQTSKPTEYNEMSSIKEPSAEGPSFLDDQGQGQNSGLLVNKLLVGVSAAQHKPEWDHNLEDESVLGDMATERLKQFTQEYDMLMHVEDDDQRILIKNHLFWVYDKVIRKQIGKEKKAKKAKKLEKKKQTAAGQPKRSANDAEDSDRSGGLNDLAIGSPSKPNGEATAKSQLVNMSNISLQSALPAFEPNENGDYEQSYLANEVNLHELLDADVSIGLQTATQKSLIKRIEEDYQQREAMKKQLKDNEAQLDYDSFVASASRASVGNHPPAPSDRAPPKDSNYYSNATDNAEKANKLIFIDSESNASVTELRSRRDRVPQEVVDNSLQKNSNESSASVSGKGTIFEANKSSKSNEKEPNSSVISGVASKAVISQRSPEYQNDQFQQSVHTEDVELEFDAPAHYQQQMSMNQQNQNARHQPNMEVIRERQSEFSMSILNDARAANSYRSRQSKGLSQLHDNSSVRQNTRKDASANQSSLLKSEAHSHSSTNIKPKKSKRTRDSFEADDRPKEVHQKFAIKTSDKKRQHKQLPRSSSQAQMHESEDLSNVDAIQKLKEAGVGAKHINVEKQRPIVTRNKASKVYKTSNSIQYTNSVSVIPNDQPGGLGEYSNSFLQKLQSKDYRQIQKQNQNRRNQDQIGTKCPSSSSLLQADAPAAQAKQQYTQLNTERDRENLTQNFFNKQPYSHRSHFPAEPSSRQNDSLDASPAPSKFSRPNNVDKVDSRRERHTKAEYEVFGSDICMGPISHVCIEGDSSLQNQFGLANNTGQYSHLNIPTIQHTSYPSDASSKLNLIDVGFGHGASLAQADPIAIDTSKVSSSLKPLNEVPDFDNLSPVIQKIGVADMSGDQHGVSQFVPPQKLETHRGLVRSSSETLLRDKQFYDMADDEDEVAVYCKLQEQGVLDVFYQRNLSEMQNKAITHLKTSTSGNMHGLNNLTNAHESLSGARVDSVAKLAELSSQGKLILMSQQTLNKMQQRAMQTQSKTFERGLISEQMALPLGTAGGNIFENVNENTGVDKNSSQQQTRGKATLNKMFGMKGLGQLYLANPNLNQALIGTNLLMTSFENVTQPLYNHIMVPTHQYNRKTLLMMQNLHNNYLYSANTGILFTGRGLTSGLVQAFGKKSTTIGGHNTNNGTNEQSFVVNMAGDSLSRADMHKVPFERAVKNSTQESLQQQFERNARDGSVVIRENVYSQVNEVSSISGEPINIQNFIRGAKQNESALSSMNQGNNCISIIDDDCKMAVDRRFLQEVKNLSHQLKGRKLFSQSNSKIAQQTSSDFSQQLTEQRFSTRQPERFEELERAETPQDNQREHSSSVLTRKAFSIKNNPKILQLIKDKVQQQQLNRKQANNSALVGGLGHSQSKTQLGDYETLKNIRSQAGERVLGTQTALHRRLADNASSQSFRKLTKLNSEDPTLQPCVPKTKLRKVSLGRRELSENSKNYLNPTHRSDQNYSSQTSTNFANLMAGLKKIGQKQQMKKVLKNK